MGGRKSPPTGPVYTTVARFDEDVEWKREAWSVRLEFERQVRPDSTVARIEFLSPDAPKHRLRPGKTFALYEGDHEVATVEILKSDDKGT